MEKKHIINRYQVNPEKGNRKINVCMLFKDPLTLFFIFKFFKENNFTENFQKHFLNELCQTAYCKELINKNFVYGLNDLTRIEDNLPPIITENNDFRNNVLLNEKQLQYINKIINISPNALFKVLSLLYDVGYFGYFYYRKNVSSHHIINDIIFGLLLDLENNIPLKYPVHYTIGLILGDEPISKGQVIKRELASWCKSDVIVSMYNSIIEEL